MAENTVQQGSRYEINNGVLTLWVGTKLPSKTKKLVNKLKPTKLVIKGDLEVLADRALAGVKVREVSLPTCLKVIGEEAFSQSEVETVYIGENVEEIGENAFFMCQRLREFAVPKKIKVIKKGTFANCSSLSEVSIKEGLEEIEEDAFISTGLEEITLPKTLKRMHKNAFLFDYYLQKVTCFANIDLSQSFPLSGRTKVDYPNANNQRYIQKYIQANIATRKPGVDTTQTNESNANTGNVTGGTTC